MPVTVLGISTATFISAGSEPLDTRGHACAVLSDGTVQCWGFEAPGPAFEHFVAIPVSMGIGSATAVAAGGFHTCALMNDGTVQCWGDNSYGQLGNGNTNDGQAGPGAALNISTATAVAAGDRHSCALLHGGTVQCWGDNSLGQLGNGTTANSAVPVTVLNVSTATAIAAGSTNACALLSDRTVQCWGDRNAVSISVTGVNNAAAISPCCAVLSDGTVHCRGCLSSQVFMDAGTSVTISGINNAVAVADGFFGIALLSDGTVQRWDEYGTLTDSISFN